MCSDVLRSYNAKPVCVWRESSLTVSEVELRVWMFIFLLSIVIVQVMSLIVDCMSIKLYRKSGLAYNPTTAHHKSTLIPFFLGWTMLCSLKR